MKIVLALITILTGLSLRAQTNIIHSMNPISSSGTSSCFAFKFITTLQFTNSEKGGYYFTNSVPGGTMSFSCNPTNDTICEFVAFPSGRPGCATNSVTWTNLAGETGYILGCQINKKLPAKSVTGTTTGLKP